MKNIAEILKDCPKGTKLYSPIFGEVELEKVSRTSITVRESCNKMLLEFYADGRWHYNGECMLFPSKDNRDWDNFCPFKDAFKEGDVLYIDCNDDEDINEQNQYIFILKQINEGHINSYCYINGTNQSKFEECWLADIEYIPRFATEEEKEKLFKAIKDNGYRWNAETKTLEKLIVPKFKVGDRIQFNNERPIRIIKSLEYDRYRLDNGCYIKFGNEGAYKLLKFNISTLKPFDKVLVRDYNSHHWRCALYERYDNTRDIMYFATIIGHYQQCIPFEGNEHLLGTTNDCDEYYKTWE